MTDFVLRSNQFEHKLPLLTNGRVFESCFAFALISALTFFIHSLSILVIATLGFSLGFRRVIGYVCNCSLKLSPETNPAA